MASVASPAATALSSGAKKKCTKSVHFPQEKAQLSQVVLQLDHCDDIPEDIKKEVWYARSDFHFSRSTARVIAKESERYGHSKQLDQVYISTFNEVALGRLKIWALHGHSRRGLERWANSSHGRSRKDDSRMYIQGMLRAQTEMKLKDCFSEERLREVGHILSRKARLFAQMCGEADAHAARYEFGLVDVRQRISPRQQIRKKNLGLVGRGVSNAHLPTSSVVPQPRRSLRRTSAGVPHTLRRSSDAAPATVRRVSDAGAVRRVSDISAASATVAPTPVRRVSDTAATAPKIKIKTRPNRVGRISRVA